MRRTIRMAMTLGSVSVWAGCNSNSSTPTSAVPSPPPSSSPTSPQQPASPDTAATISQQPYDGPPVSVAFLQMPMHPPKNVVALNLIAPSGGWTFALDRGEVVDNVAKVFLTLEQPAASETTTQALVEHQASFTTIESFDRAEIYIHQSPRQSRPVAQPKKTYRLAKAARVEDTAPPMAAPGESTPPGGTPGSSSPYPGAGSADPYVGPPVDVQVIQAKRMPPISTAVIKVTVPTGGWSLAVDHGESEGGLARIYLTLEKPGDDEVVAQAQTTLEQSYTSDSPPFTTAEIYIHQARRDVQTLTTNYRLAARSTR